MILNAMRLLTLQLLGAHAYVLHPHAYSSTRPTVYAEPSDLELTGKSLSEIFTETGYPSLVPDPTLEFSALGREGNGSSRSHP